MSKNLKGYEVFGGLLIAGLGIAWMANRDSTPEVEATSQPAPVARAAPEQVTIRSGAVICFSREDWESFKSAVMDNHIQSLKVLFDAGKCQKTSAVMVAKYLDPVSGNAALVQTPGGRGAFVFLKDTE